VLVQLLDGPTLPNWHDLHTLQGRHLAQPSGILDPRGLVGTVHVSSAGGTDSIQRDGSSGLTGRDAHLRLEAGGMRAGRGGVVRHKESDYEVHVPAG
jgi:hypothetical protein